MKLFTLLLSMLILVSACAQTARDNKTAQSRQNYDIFNPADTLWTEKVNKTNEEWKKTLTADQYNILREQGTERPFTSPLLDIHEKGYFVCVACGNPLFSSDTKFNSGTGWPSFWAPYANNSVSVASDNTMGMSRDEISCKRCGGHLGHVFNDGPKPTGLRYCMDGVAMQFKKAK